MGEASSKEMRRLGEVLSDWQPPALPRELHLLGQHVVLEPLEAARHAADLYRAYEGHDWLWDYMYDGPFASFAEYEAFLRTIEGRSDPCFLVLRDLVTGRCGGVAAYMAVVPDSGSIEVGSICIAPELQQSLAMSEAMILMMRWAFEAGYRRYEWKCNALNLPSRRAAQRLGFSYEGLFRQHRIVKGRNRDTAWFSVTDSDWPALAKVYEAWLSPENIDSAGRQKQRLSQMTAPLLAAKDPAL